MEKKSINVAINGFGRIGRAFTKLAQAYPELNIVAVNDLGNIENLAYLLKYDTAYGRNASSVATDLSDESAPQIIIDGKPIRVFSEKDPENIPWGDYDVDVVVEATGFFVKFEDAERHLQGGAKRVVISAPAKSDPQGDHHQTVLMGVNDENLKTCSVSSNGSCTTNAGSPLMTILDEAIGIEKAMLNTIHSYTSSQSLIDAPVRGGSDFRKGRAAAHNIIPSTTGAAIATTKVMTQLAGKFDGMATRVPTLTGSMADITFVAKRDTTVEEVNQILKDAANDPRWHGIFTTIEDQVVSQDIVGNRHASIADLNFTKVVDGDLVKVIGWYDNEIGYTHSLVKHVIRTGRFEQETLGLGTHKLSVKNDEE